MTYVASTLSRGKRAMLGAIFVGSAALACIGLAACDSGTSQGSAGSPTSVEAGQAVFSRYCQVCHPGGNPGAGPALRELVPKLTDEQMRSVVRTGKNRMPGYGPQEISDDELTGLVAYIRTLK